MILTTRVQAMVLAAALMSGPACEPSDGTRHGPDRPGQLGSHAPSDVRLWGCDRSIRRLPDRPDRAFLASATLVGDLGFGATADDLSVWRPHEDADFQFKLPIFIEGDAGATVRISRSQQGRVGLILADVPRRGPGNSYRVEDAYLGVRFEPCSDQAWTAWTGGLALADRHEIVLMVKVDGTEQPNRVVLGPWERD